MVEISHLLKDLSCEVWQHKDQCDEPYYCGIQKHPSSHFQGCFQFVFAVHILLHFLCVCLFEPLVNPQLSDRFVMLSSVTFSIASSGFSSESKMSNTPTRKTKKKRIATRVTIPAISSILQLQMERSLAFILCSSLILLSLQLSVRSLVLYLVMFPLISSNMPCPPKISYNTSINPNTMIIPTLHTSVPRFSTLGPCFEESFNCSLLNISFLDVSHVVIWQLLRSDLGDTPDTEHYESNDDQQSHNSDDVRLSGAVFVLYFSD